MLKRILFLTIITLQLLGCNQPQEVLDVSSFADAPAGFVGDAACMECHQTAYNDWRGSHHDWAMKLPNDTTVLGDFDNQIYVGDSVTYRFSRRDSSYFVTTVGDNGQEQEFKIVYTFGVTPLQQYLIEFPDGRLQTLRATWDTDKKIWFNQYAGQVIPPDDWLHWSQGGQRWNTMCAECHSTNLVKNYNLAKDAFNTTYSVINVSCEACHGPALDHMRWAAGDTTLGDPKILVKGYDQKSQLQLCAGCHVRRVKLTEVIRPDVAFEDQFLVQTINSEYYHPDGQIKEEDYVYGSFLQSKMYHMGIKCSDCHNVHSMQLKKQGNELCLQCHIPANYDAKNHHFHEMKTEGAECISCHMTGDVYMGNDFRRDHSFRIPRPDQSVEYDTPNACIGCHDDQSDEWAAEWIVTWYGPERADHFSDHLLKASRGGYDSQTTEEVLRFINNMKYPAIARATALEYFPLSGEQAEYQMLIDALADSSALIRYHALAKLRLLPPEQTAGIAMEHLNDKTRLVRIGAAQLIVELDINQLTPAQRSQVLPVRDELTEMLRANADFSLGRMQLGDHYMRLDQPFKAITEYEMAIQMDELLSIAYSNLATAYNMVGNDSLALITLDRLVELEPEYARGFYLRGLLKYELGDTDGAINDLSISTRLDPGDFRSYYNLANLLLNQQQLQQAEKTMNTGLDLLPNSQEGQYLLALIFQAQGRDGEAQQIMIRLQAAAQAN